MITFEENKKIVEKSLFFFQNHFKVDLFKIINSTSFSGTLSEYHLHNGLKSVIEVYKKGDMNLARILSRDLIKDIISNISISASTSDEMREVSSLFLSAADCLEGYEEFYKEDCRLIQESFKGSSLFSEEDFEDKRMLATNRKSLDNINTMFLNNGNSFRTYLYEEGPKFPDDASFYFKDTVLISDSLDTLLLQLSKPLEDDKIMIGLSMKIEPLEDFSYFIISIKYKNSVWISTDFIEFYNPSMNENRRNPRRISEYREEHNSLPYYLIDEVIKWRKENTTITKEAGQEIYTLKITDLHIGARISLFLIVRKILEQINNQDTPFPKIFNARNSISLYKPEEDDTHYFSNTSKDKLEEILSEYAYEGTAPSVELVKVSQELSTSYTRHNHLATLEQINKDAAWLKHNAIAKKMFSRQSPLSEEVSAFNKLIIDSAPTLLQYAFSGNSVYILDVDNLDYQSYHLDAKKHLSYFCFVQQKPAPFSQGLYYTMKYDREHYCSSCHKYRTKSESGIAIVFHSYKILLALTGKSREDLPMYYKNYYSHYSFPPIGNSLLDNVRPEFVAMYKDPCSSRFPNGIKFNIELCGICKRRYLSKYKKFDSSVIVLSSKKQKVLAVTSKELALDTISNLGVDIKEFDTKFNNFI